MNQSTLVRQQRRKLRVRGQVNQSSLPRLSVFRSNKHIYAQIIDKEKGKVLAASSDLEIKDAKLTKTEKALQVGKTLAEKAKKAKVSGVVFDKGPYRYHGRVEAIAKGAREGGLQF